MKYQKKHITNKEESKKKHFEMYRLKKKVEKAEKPRRTFPSNSDDIYHMHPIAWVSHMKMLCVPTTPPWMEVELSEAKAAKFVREF